MNALSHIRIILFFVMIFGAFANFAQNDWGNRLIIFCQLMLSLSFMLEAGMVCWKRIKAKQLPVFNILLLVLMFSSVLLLPMVGNMYSIKSELYTFVELSLLALFMVLLLLDLVLLQVRKKRQLPYTNGMFESVCICFIAMGFYIKNMHWAGAGIVFVGSILLFGVPLYVVKGIQFYKAHVSKGKAFIQTLSLVYLGAVLLGITFIFRIMHYPYASLIFALAMLVVAIFVVLAMRRRFEYEGEMQRVGQGFRLFKSHILSLFVALVIYGGYDFFRRQGLAPEFYEALYPPTVKELSNTGRPEDGEKANAIVSSYYAFVAHSYETGLLK